MNNKKRCLECGKVFLRKKMHRWRLHWSMTTLTKDGSLWLCHKCNKKEKLDIEIGDDY